MSEIDSAHFDSIDPDDAPELTDVFLRVLMSLKVLN